MNELNEEIELQKRVLALEEKVRPFLSKDAIARYGNIRVSHPDIAIQLLVILSRAIDAGKLRGEITGEQLKALLQQIIPQKKEFKIIRK